MNFDQIAYRWHTLPRIESRDVDGSTDAWAKFRDDLFTPDRHHWLLASRSMMQGGPKPPKDLLGMLDWLDSSASFRRLAQVARLFVACGGQSLRDSYTSQVTELQMRNAASHLHGEYERAATAER